MCFNTACVMKEPTGTQPATSISTVRSYYSHHTAAVISCFAITLTIDATCFGDLCPTVKVTKAHTHTDKLH